MGEARQQGSAENRKREAIKRHKAQLAQQTGGADERAVGLLRAGLQPFLDRMSAEQWRVRREAVA